MDNPRCWVKNVIKKIQVEVGLILDYIFNPTFGVVHILPKFVLKEPNII